MAGSERFLQRLLTSPHLIDLIGILAAAEGLWIIRRRGLPPMATVRMLLPVLFLLLALRCALAEAPWPWVPGALLAALLAHLWEVAARWQR